MTVAARSPARLMQPDHIHEVSRQRFHSIGFSLESFADRRWRNQFFAVGAVSASSKYACVLVCFASGAPG